MKKEFGDAYRGVYYQSGNEPVFCYRSGLTVYEEVFRQGMLMSAGWNAAGYPLNVLSNCNTRINNGLFAEPQSFNLDIDGEYADRALKFVSFDCEEENGGLHAVITLLNEFKSATVKVHTIIDGTPVFSRWLEITNGSDSAEAISELTIIGGGIEVMSGSRLSSGRPLEDYYTLGYMDASGGCMEGDFSWHTLTPDTLSFAGRFRRGRHRHPMYMLKNNLLGTTMIGQLAWSGGYKFSFDYDAHPEQGDTRVSYKLALDSFKPLNVLMPGETFITPAAHVGMVAGGHDDAVNSMNDHIRKSVFNRPETNARACLVGSGMGPEHDMSVETTKQFIDQMAAAGAEVFIIDAGWDCPPNQVGEWWLRAGDWDYDKDRYPDGLEDIRNYARSKGVKFGMWMEAERIGNMSKMYAAHSDWFSVHPDGSKSTGYLDFSNPEAAAWAEKQIAHVITDYKLDLFRVDYNVDSNEYFHISDRSGRHECLAVRQVQGFYRMYGNLKKRFPDVIFENCAGGGGRTDIGMVANFSHSWVSDCQTAPRSLLITNGMTMALPPERVDRLVAGMGCHAFASLDFQMRNAMFGHISLNVFGPRDAEMNPQVFGFIRHSVDLYKTFIRPYLPDAKIYHHTPDTRDIQKNGYAVLETAAPDSSRDTVGVFTMPGYDGRTITVYPRGLSASLDYKVCFDNTRSETTISGFELINGGLRVSIPSAFSSELITFEAQTR